MTNLKKIYIYALSANLIFDRNLWLIYLLSIGIPLAQATILQIFLNIAMSVFEIPSGILADKIGVKKTILLGHLCISIYLITMIIVNEFKFLLIGFLAYGIGLSLISGTDQTILYNILKNNKKENQYQKILGIYNSSVIISITLSSFLGGFLQSLSWKYVYSCSLLTQIFSCIIIFSITETNKEKIKSINDKDTNNIIKNLFIFIKSKKEFKFIIVIIGLLQGSISALYIYGQILLTENNLEPKCISFIFTIISIISIVSSIYSYKLVNLFGSNKLILLCLYISTFGFFSMISFIPTIIVISFIFINVLFEIYDTSLNSIFQHSIPDELRTTLISTANFFVSIIMIIIFSFIGYLNSHLNITLLYSLVGMFILISSTIIYIYYNKIINKSYIIDGNKS